jgi:hypothetical protein
MRLNDSVCSKVMLSRAIAAAACLGHVAPAGLPHGRLDLDEQHLQRVRVDAVVEVLLDGVAVAIACRRTCVAPVYALFNRVYIGLRLQMNPFKRLQQLVAGAEDHPGPVTEGRRLQ